MLAKNMATLATKCKVLVTHPEVPDSALKVLAKRCEITICSNNITRKELLLKCRGVDAILWATSENLNAEVLDAAGPYLKAISTKTAGMDYVDIPEVKRRGIKLGHTPNVVSDAVAEIAIGLMIAAGRRFHEGRQHIERGTWENNRIQWMWGVEIKDSTVGFVGFGGIGQAIANRLSAFNVQRILYHTRNKISNEDQYDAKHVPIMDDMLKESDFVIVACPLTPETKGIIDASAFNKMKPTSVFINIARGEIVNQRDLLDALLNKRIFAAGLDVMTPEPLPEDDELLKVPNCVIIPHLGTATAKTEEAMSKLAAENILKALSGLPMIFPAF